MYKSSSLPWILQPIKKKKKKKKSNKLRLMLMYHHHTKFGYKRWSSSEDMFWTSSDTWKDIQKDRQTVMPVHPPYSDSISSTPSTQWFQYTLLNFVTGEQNTVAGDGSRSSKQVQTCEVRSRSNNNNHSKQKAHSDRQPRTATSTAYLKSLPNLLLMLVFADAGKCINHRC